MYLYALFLLWREQNHAVGINVVGNLKPSVKLNLHRYLVIILTTVKVLIRYIVKYLDK